MQLDLKLKELKKEIAKIKPKRIFVQLPDGLKIKTKEIANALKDYEVIFSLESVFGACDLQEDYAEKINADLILHFGHTAFYNYSKIKVLYWPTYYKFTKEEVKKIVEKINQNFKNKKITIIYPIQYKELVEELKKEVKVEIIEGKTNTRIKNKGQILGCDVSTVIPILNKVDAIIYIGDGYFHSTAFVNFPTNKKIFWVNFDKIEEIKIPEKEKKRREMLKYVLKEKKIFGIYITRKTGQFAIKTALKVKEILEKNKKIVYLLMADNISNEKLMGLGIEVLVNTACPRIMDDFKNYSVLIINSNFVFDAFK